MIDLKKYSNKTKAAFILLIVMLIILLNNFNTLQNSKKANENINAIYNDRLVVEHYIFQYANKLHSIKAIAIQSKLSDNQKKDEIIKVLNSVQTIDKLYLKTVLTANEKILFETFLRSSSAIGKQTQKKNWFEITLLSDQALQTLEKLSQIQIGEGKTRLYKSNLLHNQNNALGELQIALLVILSGITIYLLLSRKNKITVKIPESPSMN